MRRLAVLMMLGLMYGCGDGAPDDDASTAADAQQSGVTPTPVVACAISNDMVATGVLPETLPADLAWETNDTDEVFASPDAVRGGTYRTWMLSFPMTLRLLGPDSNGGFAGYTRAMQLATTSLHPNSLKQIPELATHWAFGSDGISVYYKINPKARWSDGKPITADDFLFNVYMMRSKDIVDPWYNDYYTHTQVDVRKYDDHIFAVAGNAARPKQEMLSEYGLRASPCHAHKLDDNWVRDYSWLVAPSSGPYQISAIKKGQYVEFSRVDDWWANDERYFRHRFNPNVVRVSVVRDQETALRYFLQGELDSFGLALPDYWHDKAVGPDFNRGYIGKIWFYTKSPQPGGGLWLNTSDPILSDRNVRLGLAYAMNWKKVIEKVLRNDFERGNAHYENYGDYSDDSIRSLPFDLTKANFHLDEAGWKQRGPDGIRVKNGQPLALTVNYGSATSTDRLTVLREDARKAGIDLRLQLLDGAASFKMIREKKHQIGSMGWAGQGLVPAFWEFYHSDNANQAQTNNITNFSDPTVDKLIDQFRASSDLAERSRLAKEIERRVADAVVLIPSIKAEYVREGFWRWLKLPKWYGTRFTGYSLSSGLFDPLTDGLFWIDEDERQRTLAARARGDDLGAINIKDEHWHVLPASIDAGPAAPTTPLAGE